MCKGFFFCRQRPSNDEYALQLLRLIEGFLEVQDHWKLNRRKANSKEMCGYLPTLYNTLKGFIEDVQSLDRLEEALWAGNTRGFHRNILWASIQTPVRRKVTLEACYLSGRMVETARPRLSRWGWESRRTVPRPDHRLSCVCLASCHSCSLTFIPYSAPWMFLELLLCPTIVRGRGHTDSLALQLWMS